MVITNELKTILDTIPINDLLYYLYTRKSGEAHTPLHTVRTILKKIQIQTWVILEIPHLNNSL